MTYYKDFLKDIFLRFYMDTLNFLYVRQTSRLIMCHNPVKYSCPELVSISKPLFLSNKLIFKEQKYIIIAKPHTQPLLSSLLLSDSQRVKGRVELCAHGKILQSVIHKSRTNVLWCLVYVFYDTLFQNKTFRITYRNHSELLSE